jgi:preprotein translocase subunit SecB
VSLTDHHVRFATGTHLDPEPIRLEIEPQEQHPLPPEAHVGILRNHHTYGVDISISHSLGPEVSARHAQTNTAVSVKELPVTTESESGKYDTAVKLQVRTVIEGGISEVVELFVASDGGSSMEVLLTAKVIGCNRGNPVLKDGVHVISHHHTKECATKEWPGAYEENRVRFASGTHLDPEYVRLEKEDSTAHVGILRNHHTYGVDIPIPHSLGPEVSARHAQNNVSFTVLDAPVTIKKQTGTDKYETTLKVQVKTVEEGSIAETVELFAGDGEKPSGFMEVLLTATVVKCSQGNPLLKEGVHIISRQHSEECTEWPASRKEENRVRFVTGTQLKPNSIHVVRAEDSTLPSEAHVGFLRTHHTYSLDIPIPNSLGPEVCARHAPTNVNFSVMETPVTAKKQSGLNTYETTVKLQVKTVGDGSIAETIELFVAGDEGESSNSMEVLLTAKVIGCNQGNPLLKEGVHVLSHEHSKECMEWPGFHKEESHVRFVSGTQLEPNPIHLVRAEDPTQPPEAHVGLLRTHHTYSLDIPIPHSLGPEVSARHAQTNICFTVVEPPVTVESGTGTEKYQSTIKLQVKTVKEGSIAEKIEIFAGGADGEGGCMEVLLTAKVIKKNQGTPLLKDGIHIISHEHSDESDFTEWQGFSKDAEEEVDM